MKLRQLNPSQRYRKSMKPSRRRALWQQAHGKCWYCGEWIPKDEFILDHQTPFSAGGADSKRNLVVSCMTCDKMKGRMTVDEFRQFIKTLIPHGEPYNRVAFHGEIRSPNVGPTVTWMWRKEISQLRALTLRKSLRKELRVAG